MNANRRDFITLLQTVSCCAVVAIHLNGVFWTRPVGRLWITSNLIECLCYFAVPCFFMITGCTLMDFRERYGVGEFVRRRVAKTVVPFLFWTFAFYVALRLAGYVQPEKRLIDSIACCLSCKYTPLYWFFWPLFGCYLSIPFFSLVEKRRRLRPFLYLIGYAFVTLSAVPFVCTYFDVPFHARYRTPVAGGDLIYVLLGYVFGHYELSRRMRLLIYALGAVGLGAHFYGTHLLSTGEAVSTVFKGYENWPCVLYSSAVFVFFKSTDWGFLFGRRRIGSLVRMVAAASMGVYLLHFGVIRLLLAHGVNLNSIWMRTCGAVAVTVLLAMAVRIAQRIPLIRSVLP